VIAYGPQPSRRGHVVIAAINYEDSSPRSLLAHRPDHKIRVQPALLWTADHADQSIAHAPLWSTWSADQGNVAPTARCPPLDRRCRGQAEP
jgi:hypothetical protein